MSSPSRKKRRSAPEGTTPSRAHAPEPKLPHERDESSDPGASVNEDTKKMGAQAAQDVARGLVDTDIGPVLEKLDAEHFSPPATAPRTGTPKRKDPPPLRSDPLDP